jgi:hypothetical protein
MADNPFLLPDGSMDILAVTNHSRRSDTPIEGEVITPADEKKKRVALAASAIEVMLSIPLMEDFIPRRLSVGILHIPEKEVKEINPLLIEKKD